MRTVQQPPLDAPLTDAQRVESYQNAIREVHGALSDTVDILEEIAKLVIDYFEGDETIAEDAILGVCRGALDLATNTRESFDLDSDKQDLTKPPQ